MDQATENFYSQLPCILLSAARPIAGLHHTRARQLGLASETLGSINCPHCGAFNAHLRSETITPRRKIRYRVLKKTCRACGHVAQRRLENGNRSNFPSVRQRKKPNVASTVDVVPSTTSLRVAPPAPEVPRPSIVPQPVASQPASEKRSKPKKKGLQDMLARNKLMSEQQKAKPANSSGLASFLQGLQ